MFDSPVIYGLWVVLEVHLRFGTDLQYHPQPLRSILLNINALAALPALSIVPGLFLPSFGIPVTTIPGMKLEPASPAPKSLVPQLSRTCSDELWTRSDESWIRGRGGPIMRRHTDSGIKTGGGVIRACCM